MGDKIIGDGWLSNRQIVLDFNNSTKLCNKNCFISLIWKLVWDICIWKSKK